MKYLSLVFAAIAVVGTQRFALCQDMEKGKHAHGSHGEYWNQIRGPNGDGRSQAENLPIEFSETKNVPWKTAIHDQGWSSPVVWGNQIWLTTGREDGTELFAICVDLESGEIVHDIKVFDVESPQREWPELNTHATPTPIIEEGRVYVHFGAYGTACLDTKNGKTLWQRRDLKCNHYVRPASSPVMDGDVLFLTFDGVDVQYTVALDKKTGKTIWRKDREHGRDFAKVLAASGFTMEDMRDKPDDNNRKSFGTPTIIEYEGRKQLISPGAEVLYSYDLKTGDELWHVMSPGWSWNVACRPVLADGLIYYTAGVGQQLHAVRPGGRSDATDTHLYHVAKGFTREEVEGEDELQKIAGEGSRKEERHRDPGKTRTDAYLEQVWAELQAAVKAGKMSAEVAVAKMDAIKKAKLGDLDKEKDLVTIKEEDLVAIKTRLGQVRGFRTGKSLSFRGIRYGEPPTGERRFLPALPASPWQGTYDATTVPNKSMQPGAHGVPGKPDEDCLFLNIVTPSVKGNHRPVLFWIHGGSFAGGAVTRSTSEAILERGAAGVPIIAGTTRDEGTYSSIVMAGERGEDSKDFENRTKTMAELTLDGADPTDYLASLKAAYPEASPREIWVLSFRDMLRRASIVNAERATAAGPGGWLYRFDLPGTVPNSSLTFPDGAFHAAEIGFTLNHYGSPDAVGLKPFVDFYDREDPVVKRLAENWSNTIIAFARTGNPNGAGLPHWPRYSAKDRQCLILDDNPRVEKDLDAQQILDATGVRGGLVVVIGCDSPTLLAELRASESYLVHGLDRDTGQVAAARSYLRENGLYGSVTASRWDGPQLPYVDSLVNLVVASGECQVGSDEIARVLAPNGVAVKLDPESRNLKPESFFRKPWPDAIEVWSHYLYDASNNAVSRDTTVGPPRGLRWTCGPEFARSHEHFASMSAMVTAGGRLFYVIDEGPISSVYLPSQWKLVARDAFSGVLLWDRPMTNWEARLRGFRSGPPEIGRRLVAGDEKLFVSLGYGEPVTVLDAATGNWLATLAGTRGARELLLKDDVLYVLADDMTTAQHNERRDRINREFLRTSPELEIWQRLPREAFPMYGTQRVVATETGSGKLLWKREFKASGEIMPTTMAVNDGRVCLQTVSHIVCLDAVEGKELWRSERAVARSRYSWSTPTLVIHDGVVLSLDRAESDSADKSPPAQGSKWLMNSGMKEQHQDAQMVTFSLDDGKELWRAAYSENYNAPGDIFVIHGVVWVGNLRRGVDPGFTQGRDLQTGEITATIPPQNAWGHHRCYRNKATVKWLMVGRGGIQFIDPVTGTVQNNSWVRGGCQYGTMPANGLVYVPPHSCACQPEELLIGLNALSPQSSAGEGPPPLEKGPAYDSSTPPSALSSQLSHDWPTYRCDVRRSGFQNLTAPRKPGLVWTTKLSSPITAPVAADGIVFVAETDRHTLHALSAVDGEPVWTCVADGRIDSPPTLSGGRCLFGTRSGFVYCLQASDGELIWRFRAAPQDRRLFAYEQLESVWPVHGSVLVDSDGRLSGGVPTAYFAAGRSSRIDGGIRLYAVTIKTGELLRRADVKVPGGPGANVIRQSVLPDILSIQNDTVWMRGLGVDKNLAPVTDEPHLFAPRGFLDDTWWHRTYWMYGTEIGGGYSHWPDVGNLVPAGRLLVFDGGKHIYGYGRLRYRMGDGHVRPNATEDYKLFAEILAPNPQTREDARGKKRQAPVRRQIKWTMQPPFVVRSIVLVRDALLVAGGASLTESAESHGPGTFWVASREDGSRRSACTLPAPPVLDGMVLTDYGVFVSTIDGAVTCLRTKNDE